MMLHDAEARLPVTHGMHALSWLQTLMTAASLYFFLQAWHPPCDLSLQQPRHCRDLTLC